MKKTLSILVMIVLIAFGYYFYQQSQTTKQEPIKENPKKEVIKIGAILPLTGKLAVMGEYEKNAMTLALKNCEDKVKIIFEDSHSKAKDAVVSANKLISVDKVDLLITSTTGASLAVKPIATIRGINQIAFCMDPNIASDSDFISRLYIGIDEETQGIIDYFNSMENVDGVKVGILYANVAVFEKAINQNYLPFFKKKGIKVPFLENYDLSLKNFNSLIVKMKNSDINNLIILGYGFEYPSIYKPMIEQNVLNNLQVLGGWGFLYTPVEKKYIEGTLVSGPMYLFESKDRAKYFINSYKEKYKQDANFDAAFAYETIQILNNVLNKDNYKQPLSKIFHNKGNIDGIVGSYSFDINGNMIVKTGLGRIINGSLINNLNGN